MIQKVLWINWAQIQQLKAFISVYLNDHRSQLIEKMPAGQNQGSLDEKFGWAIIQLNVQSNEE